MLLRSVLIAACCGLAFTTFAQHGAAPYCAAAKLARHPLTANKGTVADAAEDNYDVKYVKLDIALTNADASVGGHVTTRAMTTAAMGEYVFELTADLSVDSVRINGISRTVTRSGDVVKAALAAALPANTLFDAQVFYHGSIVAGSAFFDRGLRNIFSGAAGRRYTFTLGEPYQALDWWPCKQSLRDKIDSSDVWITVPDTLKAGSNGLLQNVRAMTGGKLRYEWKSVNPIDYYLISAAVGRYDEYARYMHFSNSSDSMLMQHYIYPNTLAVRKPILDSTELMVNYFSSLFNRYPFWTEKYGHCQAPLSGGEEHQTMTTIGVWTNEVVPHELAHQWFGDHVTCGTWHDIWLNEGFASYAEYLYVEHFRGAAAALAKINTVHHDAMYDFNSAVPDPTGAVYVDDTTDENRIFSSRLTYNKGSAMVHALRFEAGNDTLFFNTMKLYQQQFANGTATTEQLKNLVAQQYGRNMDTFFNQWVYASGWPVFNLSWNQKNGLVFLQLDQQATGNYATHKYSTPLEIRLRSTQGDTVVRVQTNDNATRFVFTWSKAITSIEVDPNDWLLDGPGTVVKDNSLAVVAPDRGRSQVFPNPVHDILNVKSEGADRLEILDMTGRLLMDAALTADTRIDVRPLTPGLYLYRILKQGVLTGQGKFVRD